MFGDTKQLEPTVLSTGLNEVVGNAKTSPLGLLVDKKFPQTKPNMQYRSDPAITQFPAAQFYEEGELVNHPSTELNSETKQKVRQVSMKHYDIKPKTGGSVYFFVDVAYGVARVVPNGTSLQNYANADAIVTAIRRLLKKGIKADQISILTLYKGQIPILYTKIRETTADPTASEEERTWVAEMQEITASTVDSFQGRDFDITLVDIVYASDHWDTLYQKSQQNSQQSDAWLTVSSHVKNPNRTNVALTRAKYGSIIFGQRKLLLESIKDKNKASNAMGLLVRDAAARGLIHEDKSHLDTHPEAVKIRAAIPAKVLEQQLKHADALRYGFIKDKLGKVRNQKFPVPAQEEVEAPRIPTATGHQTSIINMDETLDAMYGPLDADLDWAADEKAANTQMKDAGATDSMTIDTEMGDAGGQSGSGGGSGVAGSSEVGGWKPTAGTKIPW